MNNGKWGMVSVLYFLNFSFGFSPDVLIFQSLPCSFFRRRNVGCNRCIIALDSGLRQFPEVGKIPLEILRIHNIPKLCAVSLGWGIMLLHKAASFCIFNISSTSFCCPITLAKKTLCPSMRSAIILQTINHQEGNLGGKQNILLCIMSTYISVENTEHNQSIDHINSILSLLMPLFRSSF